MLASFLSCSVVSQAQTEEPVLRVQCQGYLYKFITNRDPETARNGNLVMLSGKLLLRQKQTLENRKKPSLKGEQP